MKLHIATIGKPKLFYAQAGLQEYVKRLGRYHNLRLTHIPDKHNDTEHIMRAAGAAHKVALVIDGPQLSSQALAEFLEKRELSAKEVCFIVGGPEGLPNEIMTRADELMSLSKLTFPHDLAMVVLSEALYRASTINSGSPYHK